MSRWVVGWLVVLAVGRVAPVAAQERCLLQLLNVDRQGVQTQADQANRNYFAGGNVRMRCVGQNVWMWSDSVASYQGQVVQFIGNVRYRDSTVDMTTDFGTYFRDADRWEARGNVVLTNRGNGAVLRGPMLDYLREVLGVRDRSELFAEQRPTVTVPVTDSLGREEAPYLVVGDRIRMLGEHEMFAGGRVTVDRDDLEARADSLRMDTGEVGSGTLLGGASIRRVAEDSFHLVGRRIDLALEHRELTGVLAQEEAHLTSTTLDLVADTVALDVQTRRVERVTAWGDSIRPAALSAEGYEVTGDSVAFDTPGQRLSEARTFGRGWVGAVPDSATGERDWIGGDTVVVRFTSTTDTTGAEQTVLEDLMSTGSAQAYYRLAPVPGGEPGRSIVYTRAEFIRLTMKLTDAEATVDEVVSRGNVDGIHLQPAVAVVRSSPPRPPGGAP